MSPTIDTLLLQSVLIEKELEFHFLGKRDRVLYSNIDAF